MLHYSIVGSFWEIIFTLVGVHFVFPKSVKDAMTSWRGYFVGEMRKMTRKSVPLCIFLDRLEGEKPYSF